MNAKPGAKVVGNTRCPVMPDELVNKRNKAVTYKGQVVRVCCKKCQKKFAGNPDEVAEESPGKRKGSKLIRA